MTASRLRRCLLYGVLASSIVLCVVLWSLHKQHYFVNTHDCSEETAKLFLEELCGRYAKGYIAGSLCEPLCNTREIHVQKCIGAHGWKQFVLQAEWNSKSLILKTVRNLHTNRIMSSNLLSEMHDGINISWPYRSSHLTQEMFLRKANITLFKGILGDKTSVQSVVKLLRESVAAECITKHHMSKGRKLRNIEALNCWQLVASEEYIITSLLQGKPHIPELNGVCGNIYAVEYVAPLDSDQFLGFRLVLSGQRSWNFRVRLALALLDVIEFAEETPYGTLHCCDLKEPNFGVIEQDGELVVKMIDLDHSWFGPVISSLKFEAVVSNRTCKLNSNCTMDKCLVECNTTSGTCSNKLLSNNLQCVHVDNICEEVIVGLVNGCACLKLSEVSVARNCDPDDKTTQHHHSNGIRHAHPDSNWSAGSRRQREQQIVCRRFLTKPHFQQPNLLHNPPKSIKQQLETLLDRCVRPKNILTHFPKDLMRNLRALLQSSIHDIVYGDNISMTT